MMNDCPVVRMRESLPEYLHGTLDRRQRLLVQAHLATCEECSEELALLERCRTAMSAVPAVDMARVVGALPPARTPRREPAAGQPIPLRSGWHGDWPGARAGQGARWRIAAAALLMVGALGVVVMRGGHWPATGAATLPVAAVPGSLAGAPRLADSAMIAGATLSLGGGISDLSDDALDALLLEVDAMEALPLVEPPMVGVFVVTDQTGAE